MTLWASPADGPSTSVGPGTRLGGRYELRRPLASGGMAQVWVGLDTVLDRQVAVKVLHPHLATDTSFVARFRREAVASARLSHPSIVAVFDTVSGNGVEAMVMELIEGRTLRALLDDVGALPIDEVLHVGISIASALDEAHRAGIVHRDIKPANIMVATDHRVLVTDFGIAKAGTDADLTVTGTLLGTAKYLSPEQVTGSNIDPRSDLYSLGVLLFEALTGNVPFKADTDAATALARLHQDPPQLRSLRPNVPPELEAIVAKLMARNPNDRFSRASAVQEALVRLRANQPSSSRPFTGPAPVVPPAAWPAPPAAPSSHPPPGPEGRAVPPNPPVQERAVPPTPPPNPPRPGAPLTPAPPLPGAPVAPVPPRPGPAFDAGITTPAAMGGTGSSPGSSNPDAATHLRPPDPPVGAVAGPPLDPALIAVVSAPTPAGLSRPPVPDLGEAPGADSQAVATQRPTPGPAAAPASPGPSDIHEAGTVRAGREPPPDRGAQATERVTSGPDAAAGIHEARTIRADAGEPDAHPTPGDAPGPAVPVTTPPDVHEARTVRVDPDAGPTVWVGPEPPLRPAGPSSGAVPASADGQATVRIPPPASGPGGESADPPSSGSAALGGPMPLGGPVPPPPPGPRPVSGPLLARPPGSLPAGRPVPASEPPVPPAPATPARASSGPLRAPALDVPPGGTGPGPLAAPPDRSGPVLERVRRSGRSRVLSLIVVAAVMVTVGLLVATGAGPFGTSDDGTAGDSADGRPQAAITVASATSFDPQSRDAEKLEREDLVTRAFDGDRSTAWSTETYRREDFGGLKDGVGLLLALDDTATVHTVDLVTNTVGYTLEIYVGDSFGPDPSSWGDPAAQLGDGPATASLDLIDARGSMVLVWIRDTGRTGQKFRFELAEVALR